LMAVRGAQSQATTPPFARKQDVHKRSNPKFEVQGFSPHYSRRLLLQLPIRRCDEPDGGRARRSVSQHTVSSMPPFFAAPRARLARRLVGFVTNPRE
jgi:hypothetical protein